MNEGTFNHPDLRSDLQDQTSAISTAVRYCGFPTKGGTPCRQVIALDSESGRCVFHDPNRDPPLGARAGKMGQGDPIISPGHVEPPPPPQTLDDVTRWHSWVTGALARGQIDKATATGLAYNLQQHRAALASRDWEREAAELRAAVADLKKTARR